MAKARANEDRFIVLKVRNLEFFLRDYKMNNKSFKKYTDYCYITANSFKNFAAYIDSIGNKAAAF